MSLRWLAHHVASRASATRHAASQTLAMWRYLMPTLRCLSAWWTTTHHFTTTAIIARG